MNKTDENERKTYTTKEKILLISLVEKFKDVLENKKTDSTNLNNKNLAWEKIAKLYNSNDVTKRTEKQLKKLWDNLKQRARKSDTELKKMLEAGGAPPSEDDKDPLHEIVRSIVPTIGLSNAWDNTALLANENKQDKKEDIRDTSEAQTDSYEEIVVEVSPMYQKYVNLAQKRKDSDLDMLEAETHLRIKKLKRAIEQQEELHKLKKEALDAEKNYWQKKLEMLVNYDV